MFCIPSTKCKLLYLYRAALSLIICNIYGHKLEMTHVTNKLSDCNNGYHSCIVIPSLYTKDNEMNVNMQITVDEGNINL